MDRSIKCLLSSIRAADTSASCHCHSLGMAAIAPFQAFAKAFIHSVLPSQNYHKINFAVMD